MHLPTSVYAYIGRFFSMFWLLSILVWLSQERGIEMGRDALFYFLDDTTPAAFLNALRAFFSTQTCDGSSLRRVSLERYHYFHFGEGGWFTLLFT